MNMGSRRRLLSDGPFFCGPQVCDHAGDLGKSLSSQRFGLYGQSPALIVIEAHSPATELFSQHPILLAEIFNDLQLAVVHPPGDGDQQKPEWVEHSLRIQNPLSRLPNRSSNTSYLHADPVFGPYGRSSRGFQAGAVSSAMRITDTAALSQLF